MTRTHDDTWDLASSVGATATMVAASRAAATRSDDPLITDVFAEPLVRAVGVDVFTKLATGELALADFDASGSAGPILYRMTDNIAARTKFFDEFFSAAANAGVRQAVILAAGLDARAYRLPWPAGTTVYEVDQPDVIEFKTRTLAERGARPVTDRRPVAIDLRNDWPEALRAAGFDPDQPTAWSAEGLLPYLPPEAQDRLLDAVTALSAPGSRLATESPPAHDPADQWEARFTQSMQGIAEQTRKYGLDLDVTDLLYFGDRNDVMDYLAGRGWQMTANSTGELFTANGLAPLPDDDSGLADLLYVSGTLG